MLECRGDCGLGQSHPLFLVCKSKLLYVSEILHFKLTLHIKPGWCAILCDVQQCPSPRTMSLPACTGHHSAMLR